jgi:selenocysteine-specific elongation factor
VRGLQVHQHEAEQAYPGQRTAINLSGIEVSELRRGAVLVEPNSIDTTNEILAEVKPVLDLSFKVRRYMEVRVHIGTDEVVGKMNWLGEGPFKPENDARYVRLKLEHETVAAPGDAILIRSLSPVTTLAGGRVLQINPPTIAKDPSVWKPYILSLKHTDIAARIGAVMEQAGYRSFSEGEIRRCLFLKESEIRKGLSRLQKSKKISDFEYKGDRHFVFSAKLETAIGQIKQTIDKRLSEAAYKKGFNSGEIKNMFSKSKYTDAFLFRALQYAVNKKALFYDGERYTTESARQSEDLDELRDTLRTYYLQNRFSVATIQQLTEQFGTEYQIVKSITSEMAKDGELISIQGQYYLHREVFKETIRFLEIFFKKAEDLTIADVKNFTGSTRKWIVPLMEFLDNKNYTSRKGDVRTKGSKINV